MRWSRVVLAAVVVLVVGSVTVPAAAAVPSGTVAGTVTGDAGAAVAGATVLVLNRNDPSVRFASGVTAADGTYELTQVPAGRDDLLLCVDARAVTAGPAEGYVPECGDSPWNGPESRIRPSGVPLRVVAGGTTTSDVALEHGGGVTGTVTTDAGAPLAGVVVRIARFGDFLAATTTASDGTYHLRGLIPGTERVVCFDPATATGGSRPAGTYLGQCYDGLDWPALTGSAPSGLGEQELTVGVDAAVPDVDGHLGAGAVVTGAVRADDGGAPVAGVEVLLRLPGGGGYVTHAAASGRYRFAGLAPGPYSLCVDATNIRDRFSDEFQPECWNDRQWDPRHDQTDTPVADPFTPAAGAVTTVDVGLARTGGMAGTVTSDDGAPLARVGVYLFRGGRSYANAVTDTAGHYRFVGLAPDAAGYAVCFQAGPELNATRPGGYRNECLDNRYVIGTPSTPPRGSRLVPVPSGGVATADAVLSPGTAVTGRVRIAATGEVPQRVPVLLFDDTGRQVAVSAVDTRTGAYGFTGLPPRTNFRICVLTTPGDSLTTPQPASQCSGAVPWSGALAAPTGTPVLTRSGRAVTTNFALVAGGSIGVTLGSQSPIDFQYVVFDAAGHRVGNARYGRTDRRAATFHITGLDPGSGPYRLCFATRATDSGFGIAPICMDGTNGAVPWDGADTDVPAVGGFPVVAGQDTPGPTVGTFAKAGAVTGRVSDPAAPIASVTVTAFAPSGAAVSTAFTSSSSSYRLAGLNPATGPYRVCATAPGHRGTCWRSAAWSGTGPPPAAAVAVAVTAEKVVKDVDVTLPLR